MGSGAESFGECGARERSALFPLSKDALLLSLRSCGQLSLAAERSRSRIDRSQIRWSVSSRGRAEEERVINLQIIVLENDGVV